LKQKHCNHNRIGATYYSFIVALLLSLRRRSIHRRATAPFIVAPPVLPLSSHRHGLLRHTAVPVEATTNNFIQRAELTLEFEILIEL